MDLPGQATEPVTQDTEVLSRGKHEITGIALGDLDVALEDVIIAEAQLQRGNSHGLRDSTEVEDTLLPEASEVEKTLVSMLKGIKDHLGVAVEGSLLVFRLEKVLEVIDVLGPDLLRPEATVVIKVLSDVSDDVGLLQEETHGLLQMGTFEQGRVGQLGLDEQTGKTLTDQAGDVEAVQIILLNGLHTGIRQLSLSAVIGHTITHLLSDILDDLLVGRLHVHKFGDDTRELNQQLTVLLLLSVASEVPAILGQEILESTQQGFLSLKGNRGIILNCIETTKNEVENTDRQQ